MTAEQRHEAQLVLSWQEYAEACLTSDTEDFHVTVAHAPELAAGH
jgi:hypothetical protein